MRRFTGDLWHADKATIHAAVVGIMSTRGVEVTKVYGVTSGLYVEALTTSGRLVLVGEDEVRTYVWQHTTK